MCTTSTADGKLILINVLWRVKACSLRHLKTFFFKAFYNYRFKYWILPPVSQVVVICTARFNIKKFIPYAQRICLFVCFLEINMAYFSLKH
jgi:hypothetical protein